MIYLDYAASTPVDPDVLDNFINVTKEEYANPNSNHELGIKAKKEIDNATLDIAKLLNVSSDEIIYTSGATESNNLAIIGTALRYKNIGKHILISSLEHNSIISSCTYLQEQGFDIDLIPINKNGLVDIDILKSMIREDTILVSICSVDSEIGLVQPVEEIGKFLKNYDNIVFHTDASQAIGKVNIDYTNCDLITIAPHKFYGMNGISILVKKSNVSLKPLILGGKSTTVYRSGTPALSLIVSLSKALRLIYTDFDKKYDHIKELNEYLKKGLEKYPNVFINSNEYSIPHILNLSVIGVKPETMLHALEEYDIFISTQSACSSSNTESKAVFNLTHDKERARSSVRVSISCITTKEEIDYFLESFDKCYKRLV